MPFEPVLFDAVTMPQRSGTPRGFAVLSGLLLTASGTTATVFFLMGAWPILGFMGLEIPLVLVLIALHHHRAGRASERVSLREDSLRIHRTDPGGRHESFELQPYWTRVDLREDPATAGTLRLRCRGRSVEVGRWLAQEEKRDFARALGDALRRYREPRFNNPQLRGDGRASWGEEEATPLLPGLPTRPAPGS
ncbi:DUF2244 domain-containing protein [Roseomonas elaeocarpi]|uniref:DUF2244 domain-containing protein n=1 Tax=Roseomonas elaeocarpi TaxID=907779 RepID=UPI00366F7BB0